MTSIQSMMTSADRGRTFWRDRSEARHASGLRRVERKGGEETGHSSRITDTAMRLYEGVPLELNECVEINLAPSVSFHGTVIWVNGSNHGIVFGTPCDTAEPSTIAPPDISRGNIEVPPHRTCPCCGKLRDDGVPVASGATLPGKEGRYGGVFVPGLRVKVRLSDSREKWAVVHWSDGRIAELVLS